MSQSFKPDDIVRMVSDNVKLVRMSLDIIKSNYQIIVEADKTIKLLSDMINRESQVNFGFMDGQFYSNMYKACAMASNESFGRLHAARFDIDLIKTGLAKEQGFCRQVMLEFLDAYYVASSEHYATMFNAQMRAVTLIEGVTSQAGKLLARSGAEASQDSSVQEIQSEIDKLNETKEQIRGLNKEIVKSSA